MEQHSIKKKSGQVISFVLGKEGLRQYKLHLTCVLRNKHQRHMGGHNYIIIFWLLCINRQFGFVANLKWCLTSWILMQKYVYEWTLSLFITLYCSEAWQSLDGMSGVHITWQLRWSFLLSLGTLDANLYWIINFYYIIHQRINFFW
jgi:hypothetical protein